MSGLQKLFVVLSGFLILGGSLLSKKLAAILFGSFVKGMIFLFGLMFAGGAAACNMNNDNCADKILPELRGYFNTLRSNPNWRKSADPADIESIKIYQKKLVSCDTYKCSNQTLLFYTDQMRWLVSKYR